MQAKCPRTTAALSLWVAATSFYVLTGAGHSTSVDGMMIFLAARELVETGRPAVPEIPYTEVHRKLGRDGRWYPKYGPGLILAHLPALLIARTGDPLRPEVAGEPAPPLRRDEFYAQLTNACVTAGTITLLFLTGLALGYSLDISLAVAALAGIASPLWTYAHVDSTEAVQALGLAGACCCLLHVHSRSTRPAWAGGFLLAIAIAAKVTNFALAPWFLVYAAVRGKRANVAGRTVAAFAIPLVLVAFALGLYDLWRFGAWLDTGYDLGRERFDRPFFAGLLVLLLSPQFGLLVFFPAALLTVLGAREALERFGTEALLAVVTIVTLVIVYARWWAFWGMNWGPRFLVPAIPLLSLFLLPVATWRARAMRAALLAAALGGAAVAAVSVSVSFFPQVWVVYEELGLGKQQGLVSDPRLSPLRIGIWSLGLAARRADTPTTMREYIERPPWAAAHPWREPERAVERLSKFAGLDLWAAPAAWRRDNNSIWPFNDNAPKPTSSRLRTIAIAGLISASAGLLRLLVRR